MADQRFAAPVLADGQQQTAFNLAPFAGARREVADRDLQPGFVGQLLHFPLPQPHARTSLVPHHGAGTEERQRTGVGVQYQPAVRQTGDLRAALKDYTGCTWNKGVIMCSVWDRFPRVERCCAGSDWAEC